MNILIAGFGNLLRNDDGFGVLLLRRLQTMALNSEVRLFEVGIGGISLVQELLSPCDALIVLDAIEGDVPGVVRILEITPQSSQRADPVSNDEFADIHYAEPGRAVSLAKEIGALPPHVYLVGCVPLCTELGDNVSPVVQAALEPAAHKVRKLVVSLIAGRMAERPQM